MSYEITYENELSIASVSFILLVLDVPVCSGQVRCVRTGRTFEVELAGQLERTGVSVEKFGSMFASGAPWPLFRGTVVGRWEVDDETETDAEPDGEVLDEERK